MIGVKAIKNALKWADGYTKLGCPEAVTLAAAYREKCEELELEKKIRESYRDSARVLYEENDRLRSKMLGAYDYPTIIGGRA